MTNHKQFFLLILVWTIIGIFSRCIPHLPNLTPLIALSLLAGAVFSRKIALLLILTTMVISDLLLAWIYHYPPFGYWTLFTYSGFISIAILGQNLSTQPKIIKSLFYAVGCCLGYWIWTNFGVWLFSNMYARTLYGLLDCYVMALPFLRNDIVGSVGWMVILLGSMRFHSPLPKSALGEGGLRSAAKQDG